MPVNAELRERLPQLVPFGYIATKAWLRSLGLSLHSIDNLVKSRQLINDIEGQYKAEFVTMSEKDVSIGVLNEARMDLTYTIQTSLTD